jgi:hypothetical protein
VYLQNALTMERSMSLFSYKIAYMMGLTNWTRLTILLGHIGKLETY